ncbi:MAG: hypothetical protein AAF198_06595 [Pseudomonadota bacterium]
MQRILSILFFCILGSTAHAVPLLCNGQTPFWSLTLDENAQTADLDWIGEIDIKADIALTALALGDAEIKAHSLTQLSQGFTAIALVAPQNCSLKDQTEGTHRIELLTQSGNEAVLLTGCCSEFPQ